MCGSDFRGWGPLIPNWEARGGVYSMGLRGVSRACSVVERVPGCPAPIVATLVETFSLTVYAFFCSLLIDFNIILLLC